MIIRKNHIKKIMLNKDKLTQIYKRSLIEDNITLIAQETVHLLEKEIEESNIRKSDVASVLKAVREHFSARKKQRKEQYKEKTNKADTKGLAEKTIKEFQDETTDKLFTKEEIESILKAAQKTGIKEQVITKLFFKLGLTLVEIANLEVEQIDKLKKMLNLKTRSIHVDDDLMEQLLQLSRVRRSGKIFHTADGHFTKTDVLSMIRALMESAGVKKRNNLESVTQQYISALRKEGKAFMYWEHQDEIIKLRSEEVKKKFSKRQE